MIKIAIVFLSFMLAFSAAKGQEVWTLENCIEYALQHNLNVKQADIDVVISEKDVKQSRMNLLPDFYGNGNNTLLFGKSIDPATNEFAGNETIQNANLSLSANVNLFNGFQRINTIQKSNIDYLATKYDAEVVRNDIRLRILNAFLTIIFNIELNGLAQQQVEVTKQQVDRLKLRVDAGGAARANLLDLEAQYAQEQLDLVNTENQVNLSTLALVQLLQLSSDQPFEISYPAIDSNYTYSNVVPVTEVYQQSLEIMPEIKSAELKYESSLKDLSIAKGGRYPTLNLGGDIGSRYTSSDDRIFRDQFSDNAFQSFGFNLSVPIFTRWSIQYQIDRSKLQSERANTELKRMKDQLKQDVETAYADVLAASNSYEANKRTVTARRESFKYAQQRFELGVINSVDFNSIKNDLRRAESDMLRSKYDLVFKSKILDFFQGRPLKF